MPFKSTARQPCQRLRKTEHIMIEPETIEVDADFMVKLQAFGARQARKKEREAKKKGKHVPGRAELQKASDACFGGED